MKGLLLLSNDIEDVEALATRALLVRAGMIVTSVSLENTKNIITAFGLQLQADALMSEISVDEYDFLIIPGGKYVAKTIDKNTIIPSLAKKFANQEKLITAICAGPRFLGRAGLLEDKNYTAFLRFESDIANGKYQPHHKALTDGRIITSRGAGTVYEFVYEIVKYLKDEKASNALLEDIKY